ncbi:MAG: class I SAM-dependent methyltransferase [Burkholderiales bacterium]|nr:class I SAM-dependent methyltransferase [Burkholderiales bacterium]
MQALLQAIAQAHPGSDAERLFHGRGGLHAGAEAWTLDWFPPCWVLSSFEPVNEAELARLAQALAARRTQAGDDTPLTWLYHCRQVGHEERAAPRLMAGHLPEPHAVGEDGARFLVHLTRGQNHGLFLDMREGRSWLRRLAPRKVLNLFAYSCAFSVVALQAGAEKVLNVDMSPGALALGRRNHLLNGVDDGRAQFLAHDVFNSWGKLTRAGPYDAVLLDPPMMQKGSFVAEKDWPRLMRRLPSLVAPGGHALLALNSPKLGPTFLKDAMAREAPELQFVERLANPPAFADADEDRSLKVLIYRRPVA